LGAQFVDFAQVIKIIGAIQKTRRDILRAHASGVRKLLRLAIQI
jgi:hypothetical protein